MPALALARPDRDLPDLGLAQELGADKAGDEASFITGSYPVDGGTFTPR